MYFFSVCKAEQEKGKNECIERQKFTRNRVSKLQEERKCNAEHEDENMDREIKK